MLLGAVGVVAAAAGAGLAWWKFEPRGVEAEALASFWSASFDTPSGPPLAMRGFQGRPLLINFWATWCPPCVEEMPLIDAFYREHMTKGWQVVGLAIDQPSAVRAFLGRRPVRYPIGMAGLEGTSLGKSLGNASGGLPFSVVVGTEGNLLHRKMGRLLPADLAGWARGN
jgi:thiol-disulfide isomerase/thioredoxin